MFQVLPMQSENIVRAVVRFMTFSAWFFHHVFHNGRGLERSFALIFPILFCVRRRRIEVCDCFVYIILQGGPKVPIHPKPLSLILSYSMGLQPLSELKLVCTVAVHSWTMWKCSCKRWYLTLQRSIPSWGAIIWCGFSIKHISVIASVRNGC